MRPVLKILESYFPWSLFLFRTKWISQKPWVNIVIQKQASIITLLELYYLRGLRKKTSVFKVSIGGSATPGGGEGHKCTDLVVAQWTTSKNRYISVLRLGVDKYGVGVSSDVKYVFSKRSSHRLLGLAQMTEVNRIREMWTGSFGPEFSLHSWHRWVSAPFFSAYN